MKEKPANESEQRQEQEMKQEQEQECIEKKQEHLRVFVSSSKSTDKKTEEGVVWMCAQSEGKERREEREQEGG